jgi:hypothetical protein
VANRGAVTTAIEPLLRKRQSGSRETPTAKAEAMVASYLSDTAEEPLDSSARLDGAP